MNIEFATHEHVFENTDPGFVEETFSQSFCSDVKSVQVSLQGFTLNYEHKEHGHKAKEPTVETEKPIAETNDQSHKHGDEHVACVDLEVVLINGNTVKCKASAKTPKDAKVNQRRVKVLFIATT